MHMHGVKFTCILLSVIFNAFALGVSKRQKVCVHEMWEASHVVERSISKCQRWLGALEKCFYMQSRNMSKIKYLDKEDFSQ